MGSGGGGGDGGGMAALMQQGTPMPGLPIAGQGGGVNPREYGQFQNFLPEPVAEGQNPMATGLRPDMLKFRSPGGVTAEGSGGGGGGGDIAGQIQGLRDELAKLTAGGGGGGAPSGDPFQTPGGGGGSGNPLFYGHGGGGNFGGGGNIGTMGMGGRGVDMGGYTGRDTYVTPQGLALSRNPIIGPQFKNPEGSLPGYAPATKWGDT